MQFGKGLETDMSELEDCTKQQAVKLVLKSILLAMKARILFPLVIKNYGLFVPHLSHHQIVCVSYRSPFLDILY